MTYTLSESIEQLAKPSKTVPLADRCAASKLTAHE